MKLFDFESSLCLDPDFGGCSIIPPSVKMDRLGFKLQEAGFKMVYQGKVWQTWTHPKKLPEDKYIRLATNRISIFDFVLNAKIPHKGQVLNQLSMFWDNMLRQNGIKTHFVSAWGNNPYFDSKTFTFLKDEEDMGWRASIVDKLDMVPIESIIRNVLTGSANESYIQKGTVFGQRLPPGMFNGNKLPYLMFTPTTKEACGHDEAVPEKDVFDIYGSDIKTISILAFSLVNAFLETRGFMLADTKLEFGYNKQGDLVLADEMFTPDSSRFFKISEWEEAQKEKKAPSGWDKQPVRDWGKNLNPPISNKLDPENEEDVLRVQNTVVPEEIIQATSQRYQDIYEIITG
jgi:phosphoribosylaminoimidazole-succinocarboxamide synthase